MKKDFSNPKSENQVKNTSKNQGVEVIQFKPTYVLIPIKSLQGVKTTQTSFHSLEYWGDLSLLSSLL
jgi:hypothetical protein